VKIFTPDFTGIATVNWIIRNRIPAIISPFHFSKRQSRIMGISVLPVSVSNFAIRFAEVVSFIL
jgi:hypothetical protein